MLKLSLSFSSLLLLLLYSIIVCSGMMNITTDESSLLALKSSININSHPIIMTNWSNASSVCEWKGVTCGTRNQRVIALDISNMGLFGTIPPQIGNLSFLVSFNASGNNLTGSLPDDLTHLRRLRVFDVSSNNLVGEVPLRIGFLSNLRILILHHNLFTGSVPLSFLNLSKLETADLSFNQFSGSITSIIFNVSTLESLRIIDNHFSGTIPLDLCLQLINLRRLEVTSNALSGELPKSLSICSKVRYLGLNYNHFVGTIPPELGNLTSLEALRLGGNNLVGRIPKEIGCLHDLKLLEIENNQLTGLLPPHMSNMSSLQVLNLNTNKISGTIPRKMSNLEKLDYLLLQFNSLGGSIPWGIFNISSLLGLALGFNHLSGSLPPKMGYKLQHIIEISLNVNNLSGAIPSYISNCSKLKVLFLDSNSFSGPVPNSLGELKFLERLTIFRNSLTSKISSTGLNFMTSLTNCRYLRKIDISNNPLNIVLPNSFGNLSNSLEIFVAFRCNIKGKISNEVGNLSSLMGLDLSHNELTGVVPRGIRGLNQLQRLNLGYNKLTGSLPNSICNLKYLDTLSLSKNWIWGSIPECMENVTSLRDIYLDSNRLRFNIPSSIWNLKDLLNLDLSSNFLNGSLHPEIGNMKVAIYINLSSNQFSGYIPTTIGAGLQSLIKFSLANNLLQGSIPDSFGGLICLEYLDLSNNNLTGGIPRSLEKLHYLRGLNVSFNRLSGEIPSKGQFVNFTYQSFLSNEDLCGSPRLRVPPCTAHSNFHPLIRRALWIVLISVAMFIVGISVIILLLWKCKSKNSTANGVNFLQEIVPLRISYYELQRATQGFSSNNLLGAGSFGSVYKGTFGNGLLFAIKVFNLQVEDAFKSFATECEVLRNLRHRNLTKVISACSNTDFKALILQYMPNGSLDSWLYSDQQSLHIMQRLNIMIDVACALEYLHHGYSSPIAHCDLKPTNVLIDEDMVGHVSDFGIAKLLGDDESVAYTITMATIGYIAPEYGSNGMVSTKCDIYSYGIMLMEVFTKRKPNDEMFTGDLSLRSWVSNSLSHTLDEIVDPTLMRPEESEFRQRLQCISSILELALSCTTESPEERMDVQTVLTKLNKIKHECLIIF